MIEHENVILARKHGITFAFAPAVEVAPQLITDDALFDAFQGGESMWCIASRMGHGLDAIEARYRAYVNGLMRAR